MALYDSNNNRLLDTNDNVLEARVAGTIGTSIIKKQFIGDQEISKIYIGSNLIYEKLFSISVSITNGTYAGSSQIVQGGISQVRIIPNENYTFPSSVTVSGATSSYDSATGVITLSNVTSDVTISATCPLALPQLDAPVISLNENTLTYTEVPNAEYYDIYVDGVLEETLVNAPDNALLDSFGGYILNNEGGFITTTEE